MSSVSLDPVFSLRSGALARVGEERIRLLRAVQECRSISAAARACGVTYKAAWDSIDLMNNLFARPLVAASRGGRQGGGAYLTREGEQVVRAFELVRRELAQFLSVLEHTVSESESTVLPSLLWSFVMRTSARNALRCRVVSVIEGPVNAEVDLELAEGARLVAVITDRSVKDLGLEPGREVVALIKSSFVIVAREEEVGRTSARNCLRGVIARRDDGTVSTELSIDIGGGKTLVAVITTASADELGLRVGDRACALIKASHVILAVD